MRMFVLILALTTTALAAAEMDIEKSIQALGDEEFKVREEASNELAKLPKEYAKILLERSRQETDIEVSSRLLNAAKRIFMTKIVAEDESWLSLHGEFGATVVCYYESFVRKVNKNYEEADKALAAAKDLPERDVWVVRVTSLDSDADKKLKACDVIISVDGKDISAFDMHHIIPGKKYKLTVMRPTVEPKESDYGDGTIRGRYPEEYERLEIEVVGSRKDDRALDYDRIDELELKLWRAFTGYQDPETESSSKEACPGDGPK